MKWMILSYRVVGFYMNDMERYCHADVYECYARISSYRDGMVLLYRCIGMYEWYRMILSCCHAEMEWYCHREMPWHCICDDGIQYDMMPWHCHAHTHNGAVIERCNDIVMYNWYGVMMSYCMRISHICIESCIHMCMHMHWVMSYGLSCTWLNACECTYECMRVHMITPYHDMEYYVHMTLSHSWESLSFMRVHVITPYDMEWENIWLSPYQWNIHDMTQCMWMIWSTYISSTYDSTQSTCHAIATWLKTCVRSMCMKHVYETCVWNMCMKRVYETHMPRLNAYLVI